MDVRIHSRPVSAPCALKIGTSLLLSVAAGVVNAGYRAPRVGIAIRMLDAHWNGKTVMAWRRFCERYANQEEFDRLHQARRRAGR